jgi:hypothetical protein
VTAKEENIPKDRKAIKSIELETALACDVGILSSPKKRKKEGKLASILDNNNHFENSSKVLLSLTTYLN